MHDNSAIFPKEMDIGLNCFIPHYFCLLNIIFGILYSGVLHVNRTIGSDEITLNGLLNEPRIMNVIDWQKDLSLISEGHSNKR